MKKISYKITCLTTLLAALLNLPAMAQTSSGKTNTLYQYGIGPAFLGGLFKNGPPAREFKRHGSFGIGAPSLVDGELIEVNGKVYQTKSDGSTGIAPDSLKVPFGMSCFFKPDTAFRVSVETAKASLEKLIDSYLKNKNGIYAIRLTGKFNKVQTRAFHALTKEPWPKFSELQANQQLFNFAQIEGTFFGFRMPAFMASVNATGYHFHFLSAGKSNGGHVIDYTSGNLLVEIALIKNVQLEIPQDDAFSNY